MENKQVFINRLKSFIWRLGAYAGVATLSFIADNVGLLKIDPQYQVVIALVIGEVTKFINNKYTLK